MPPKREKVRASDNSMLPLGVSPNRENSDFVWWYTVNDVQPQEVFDVGALPFLIPCHFACPLTWNNDQVLVRVAINVNPMYPSVQDWVKLSNRLHRGKIWVHESYSGCTY